MPAEWEAHEATWLAWPHELTDWPGKFAPIPWAFAEIVRHLARVERVFLLVENRESEARVRAILAKAGVALEAVEFFYVPTDRGWMRDSGPIGVVEDVAATEEGNPQQIPRTTSRAPENQGKAKDARDFARDDIPQVDGALLDDDAAAGIAELAKSAEAAVAALASSGAADIEERSLDSVSRAHTPREEKDARNSAQDDVAPRDLLGSSTAAPAGAAKNLASKDASYINDPRALLNFGFNGWAKYDDYKKDAKAVSYVHRRLRPKPPLILPEHKGRRVVLEGGAIDVNGCGTLLTTEQCLLGEAQSRNPGYTRFDYAQIFKKYLGVTNVVWLKNGIAGDDTNGHVDDLARFVNETTVVTVVEDDPAEMNYPELQENLAMLRGAKDQAGEPLRVETLPMPRPVMFDGQRLPASYANFYIANKIVLVPTFNDRADRLALNTLAELFPTREIVPIYCRDLVLGLGTIHCMTQQFPRI
jgi:agmatine/peptidylarginine deiminase